MFADIEACVRYTCACRYRYLNRICVIHLRISRRVCGTYKIVVIDVDIKNAVYICGYLSLCAVYAVYMYVPKPTCSTNP